MYSNIYIYLILFSLEASLELSLCSLSVHFHIENIVIYLSGHLFIS